jgi:hypothetical protein
VRDYGFRQSLHSVLIVQDFGTQTPSDLDFGAQTLNKFGIYRVWSTASHKIKGKGFIVYDA